MNMILNRQEHQGRQGEVGWSRMHLTCIRASERRYTDVPAGAIRSLGAAPGMAWYVLGVLAVNFFLSGFLKRHE
jgi:hypothetical protein